MLPIAGVDVCLADWAEAGAIRGAIQAGHDLFNVHMTQSPAWLTSPNQGVGDVEHDGLPSRGDA